MRVLIYSGLLLIVFIVGYQVYSLNHERLRLEAQAELNAVELGKLKEKQARLESDSRYFANPYNRIKELLSNFDYERPGEKLIKIVVPESATTTEKTDNPKPR